MLAIKRRHTPQCRHRRKGENFLGCQCPLMAKGTIDGRRIRVSLKTRDMRRAVKRLAAIEHPEDAPPAKSLAAAADAFVKAGHYLAPATLQKRTLRMAKLTEYAAANDLLDVADFTPDDVQAYLVARGLSPLTTSKELETLCQFFEYCRDRDWCRKNPAKKAKGPTNLKPKPVEPYTAQEMARILAACDRLGRTSYERLRARAMVLTLRYTGLRISDVATLARDRIRDGQILLHTRKTGAPVYLPVHAELQRALDSLPLPRGGDGRYFFWSGSTMHSAVNVAERMLQRVFQLSEVKGAHAHRFRHTLATEILAKGGTEQDVADVLGISPAIVRKHYAKWSAARQQRITDLMQAVHGTGLESGTFLAHTEKTAVIQ